MSELQVATELKQLKDDFIQSETSSSGLGGADLGRSLRKRWPQAIAVAVSVFVGVALSTFSTIPKYQSETLILLDQKTAVPIVNSPTDANTNNLNTKDLSTEIQILQSQSLIAKAINKLDDSYKNIPISYISKNLSIRQVGQAEILIVSYTDTIPDRAKAVLEALGATYVNYSLEKKRGQATNAIEFINQQLPQAQQDLNESALAIRAFRQRYSIVDPDSYADIVVKNKESFQEQAQALAISINQNQRRYQELRRQMEKVGQNPDTALAKSLLAQDAVYQKIASNLKEIEAKYTVERTRYYDNHPIVENLKQQRDQTLRLLQERSVQVMGNAVSQVDISDVTGSGEIQQGLASQLLQVETDLASQMSQFNSILQAQTQVAGSFQQIPQLQQAYAELQRQVKIRSDAVNRFLEKLQELRISEAQETAPWRILEPPHLPDAPISPNIQRNLLLGMLAGGVLGIGFAVLLERLDQRVKRVEEIKELTGIPLLGVVPRVENPDITPQVEALNGKSRGYDRSPFTEAFRSLALNLRFLGASGQVKTLAFTSSTPGEGKSTLVYNLGLSLAELGQRVLIVDADMRKPKVHKLWQIPNAVGLSTAIATDKSWDQLTHSFSGGKITVLTSGPNPPNPVALLESEKMAALLKEWRQTYDYVLLDSTPIVGVADAQSLAAKVDSVVFVAAMEGATRAAILRATELLKVSKSHIAGLVVNMVDTDRGDIYYSYYSYYGETTSNGNSSNANIQGEEQGDRGILGNFWRRRR